MRLYLGLCLLILLLACPIASAQFVSVSGTVTDPTGALYQNGSYVANLIVPGGANNIPTFGSGPGTAFATVSPLSISGSMDSFGSFSSPLFADNNAITPAGTTWTFLFCSNPTLTLNTRICFYLSNVTITGASMSLTVAIKAAAAPLPISSLTSFLGLNNTFTGSNTFANDTLISTGNKLAFGPSVATPYLEIGNQNEGSMCSSGGISGAVCINSDATIATITAFSITSNVVTIIAANSFATGQYVTISGLSTGVYLNGQVLTVIATGLSATQFEANFTHADVGLIGDSGSASAETPTQVGADTNPPSLVIRGIGYPFGNGYVGIQTTTPQSVLEVSGEPSPRFSLTSATTGKRWQLQSHSNGSFFIYEQTDSANPVFTLSPPSSGSVGVVFDTFYNMTNTGQINFMANNTTCTISCFKFIGSPSAIVNITPASLSTSFTMAAQNIANSFTAGTVLPAVAGGTDLGSASLPFGNLWLGTAAGNNFKFIPGATAAQRLVAIPDPGIATNLGLNYNATSGYYQTKRNVAGCTTPASIGSACASNITVGLVANFPDTNYSAGCSPVGAPTNLPSAPYVVSKLVGSFTVNYVAITAAAASWPNLDCWAIHD